MKKVLIAAAVLALFLVGWWKWPSVSPEDTEKIEPKSAELAMESRHEELTMPGFDGAVRTAADKPAEQPAFHFRGRVVDGETGEPLADATVELHAVQQLRMSEIKRRCASVLWRDWNVSWEAALGWPYVPGPVSPAQRADQEPVAVCVPPDAREVPLSSARTGADGGFDLVEHDPRGFYVCNREGYATRLVPMRRTAQMYVMRDGKGVLETVALDSLLVRMYRVRSVNGFVLDEQGQRVHERIRLRFDGSKAPATEPAPVGDPASVGSWAVETDADGSFSFEAAAHRLQVTELDPRWSICNEGINPDDQRVWTFGVAWEGAELDKPLRIFVRRTPVLRVRDRATHEPIEDLLLVARAKVDGHPRLSGRFFAPKGELRLVSEQMMFRDRMPYEGDPVLLTAWAAGYGSATVEGTLDRSGPDLEVELARGELPLAEGVLMRGGKGLSGVPISISPEGSEGYGEDDFRLLDAAQTDGEGRFSFRMPAGFYVLRWTAEGVPGTRGIDLPLASALVIDLSRAATLRVHVRDANGVPSANHLVLLESRTTSNRRLRTDPNGDASFEGLSAGTCQANIFFSKAMESGVPDFDTSLELSEGEVQTLEIVIPADEPRFAHLAVAGEKDLSSWRVRGSIYGAGKWQQVEADGRIPIDIQNGVDELEFEHGGALRWSFWLPKERPADLVLRIDLAGPAYDVELVDATTRAPVHAVIVGVPRSLDHAGGPVVSAATDAQGRLRLPGLASASTQLFVRLREFEPEEGDLLSWNHGLGACAFEPTQPAASSGVHLTIELPKFEEQRFTGLPELKLSGVVRSGGRPLEDFWASATALVPQTDGTLVLRARNSNRHSEAKAGRFELMLPLSARARVQVYDTAAKKTLGVREWEPTPGLLEQSRDFDF